MLVKMKKGGRIRRVSAFRGKAMVKYNIAEAVPEDGAEGQGYETRDLTAGQYETKTPPADDLAVLRQQYKEVVGKQPYHGWDAATLRQKMAEAVPEDGAEGQA